MQVTSSPKEARDAVRSLSRQQPAVPEADDAAESWGKALERVLGWWV